MASLARGRHTTSPPWPATCRRCWRTLGSTLPTRCWWGTRLAAWSSPRLRVGAVPGCGQRRSVPRSGRVSGLLSAARTDAARSGAVRRGHGRGVRDHDGAAARRWRSPGLRRCAGPTSRWCWRSGRRSSTCRSTSCGRWCDAIAGAVTSPYLSLFGIDPGPDYPGWLGQRIAGSTSRSGPTMATTPTLSNRPGSCAASPSSRRLSADRSAVRAPGAVRLLRGASNRRRRMSTLCTLVRLGPIGQLCGSR